MAENEYESKLNPMEKMRIRLAAEGYNSFNNDEESSATEDNQMTKDNKSTKSSPKEDRQIICVCLVIALIIIFGLAILLVVQHWYFVKNGVCSSPECTMTSGKMLSIMNVEADPCDDFYEFACGKFDENPLIPPDKSKWGSFGIVEQINQAQIKKLLDKEGHDYNDEPSTAIKKAKTFFKACMDVSATEKRGITPMLKVIKDLGSWPLLTTSVSGKWEESSWELEDGIVKAHLLASDPLFGMGVGQDDKNSSLNKIVFDQSGLTFSDYTNYIGNSTQKYEDAFVDFVSGIALLLGASNETLRQDVQDIWDFEAKLAEVMDKPEQRVDAREMYHLMTEEQLQEFFGDSFDLKKYLRKMFPEPVSSTEHVLVYAPRYIKKMAAIVKDTSKRTLANYVVWHGAKKFISYLPQDFQRLSLQLSEVMRGISSSTPKWEICVGRTVSSLGFAVGALFVEQTFSPKDKKDVEEILSIIRSTFEGNIPKLDWMDSKTKATAIDKAQAVTQMIGYPDYIKDRVKLDEHYENLTIKDDSFQNVLNIIDYAINKNVKKRNEKPDFTEWGMMPSEVNAYYSPNHNQIVFPAGILRPPFFSPDYPMAVNFGAMGMVMGHELTHGFDSMGRLFDKYGNLDNWWGNSSAEKFEDKTKCLIDQYSRYKVGDSHLNGVTTLGENIADNGGLKNSFYAYHSWLKGHGFDEDKARLPGLNMTEDQLFFLGFAQVWCSHYTPEYAKQSLITDVHSYAKYRVIGTLSNMPEFSETFKCDGDAKMNPKNKCTVW